MGAFDGRTSVLPFQLVSDDSVVSTASKAKVSYDLDSILECEIQVI